MPGQEPTGCAEALTRWLSTDEQHLWLELREFLSGMPRVIDRQLSRDSEVSGVEYAVLAAVSEATPEGVRSGDLAAILEWERSRVSHLLRRMECKGLVGRCAASDDGRGQKISLTDDGWATVRAAAPGHVNLVRETIFDPLTRAELAQLRASLQKIRAAAVEKGLW